MRRILFQWRGITVWSYPAMLYVGLVTGVVAGNIAAHAARIDAYRVFIATLILIVPALISARLLYVAEHWTQYSKSPRRAWDRAEGGLSMFGGLPVMLALSVPLLRALDLGLGAFWDVASFTILVGMIFTRIGCLLNGCCAGRPSRSWFSIRLPNYRGVWDQRLPTQCLEALWAAVLLGIAVTVRPWLPFPGALFLLVAAGYSFGRLVLELAREPVAGAHGVTISYVISGATAVLAIATLLVGWRL